MSGATPRPRAALFGPEPLVFADVALRIDPAEVLRFQGYKPGIDRPDDQVRAVLDEALALGASLAAPRAVFSAHPAETSGSQARVAGVPFAIPEIGRLWGPIRHAGIALCTIGAALEARVAELFDARELPLAVMLDSVGSAAVESLAEHVNDWLCATALAEGVKVTNRISPGYAGWAVEDQRALFALCQGERAGIDLNASCFMTPVKSISMMVGIGPEARVDHYFTQCRRCWMRDCSYRRVAA